MHNLPCSNNMSGEMHMQADKNIFFVASDYQADLKIYFVSSAYQAGWKKVSKKYLLY